MLQKMSSSHKISFFTCNLAITCFTHLLLFSLLNAANINGLTIDLIHRNSPMFPTYNPSSWDWNEAYRRSMARSQCLRKTSTLSINSLDSEVIPGEGEYYMKISFGSPPIETFAMVDTGSDLTWIQCEPCTTCYKQNFTIFDPTKSSTYQKLPCKNKFCLELGEPSCRDGTCQYEYKYADKSTTKGDIAFETVALGSNSRNHVSFPRFVIGCGHDNKGIFDPTGAGIVGFGGGPLSLISQLDYKFQGKFSYCLVPPSNTSVSSKIQFGQDAIFSGPGKVSTPLVSKSFSTSYRVTLIGISIGDQKVFSNIVIPEIGQGNMVVDSGTEFTLVPNDLYSEFESRLVQLIRAKRVQNPENPTLICYKYADLVNAPIITFHFTNADVKLNPMNTFKKGKDDVACLTVVSSGEENYGLFGNIAQMNFQVGYDLKAKTVSFMPTDCTKQ